MNSSRNLIMPPPGMNPSLSIPNDWTTPRMHPRRRAIQRISPGSQTNTSNVIYPQVPPVLGWQHWNDAMIMQQTSLPIAPVTIVEVRTFMKVG